MGGILKKKCTPAFNTCRNRKLIQDLHELKPRWRWNTIIHLSIVTVAAVN